MSPTYLENNSGPLTAKKFNPDSVAKAFAINVLLHPGGPYNKVPFGGVIPSLLNDSGFFKGHSILCLILFIISLFPPISSHLTFGTSIIISFKFIGFISPKQLSIIYFVIIFLFSELSEILNNSVC